MATIIDIEGFFSRRGIRMFDVWLNSIRAGGRVG